MRILGIDPSLTAFAMIGFHEIGVKKILIKSKLKGPQRLREIKEKLEEQLEELSPDYVGIEGYGFCSQKGVVLGELGGVIRVAILEFFGEDYDKKVFIIPPTTLKKFITGSGRGEKALMMMKTLKNYNVEFIDNNLCDAYCIAKVVESCIDDSIKLNQVQQDIVNKLKEGKNEKYK